MELFQRKEDKEEAKMKKKGWPATLRTVVFSPHSLNGIKAGVCCPVRGE